MTPSEIIKYQVSRMDQYDKGERVGYGSLDAHFDEQSSAAIRDLEAKLKIATEALYEIMTEDFTEHQLRLFVSGVLASIKSL